MIFELKSLQSRWLTFSIFSQIWFQNRRQITRRKAQPLSPYEIMSSLRSSQGSTDTFIGSSLSPVENYNHHESSCQSTLAPSQLVSDDRHCKLSGLEPKMAIVPGIRLRPNLSEPGTTNPTGDSSYRENPVFDAIEAKKSPVPNRFVDLINSVSTPKQSAIHPPRTQALPGYLANRRSAMHQERHMDKFPSSLPRTLERSASSSMTVSSLPIKHHTPSTVRLSLSMDGKARVITGADDPPSPPRMWSSQGSNNPEKRPNGGGLQRSHSALEPFELPSAFPRRSMAGRSRDARTWEFYCDSEAGNTLTTQAELERSGSAVGPIGLLRSGSNKAMRPNRNKGNVLNQNHQYTKTPKSEAQSAVRPNLGRTFSSVARLQTIDGNEQRFLANSSGKDPKRKLPSSIFEDEDGDSDKENWEPGTQRRPAQRRRATQSQGLRRGVLEESPVIPSQSSSLESLLNRENSSPRPKRKQLEEPGQENNLGEAHDEFADLIQPSSLPRAREDLEGVQNLLALSQASWF